MDTRTDGHTDRRMDGRTYLGLLSAVAGGVTIYTEEQDERGGLRNET